MPTRTGSLIGSSITPDANPVITSDLLLYLGTLWPADVSKLAQSFGAAPAINSYPVSSNPAAKNGSKAASFFNDYYERIHITPAALVLGQIVADQTQDIRIWNAYTVPKTLNTITATGADGLSFTDVLPITLQANHERIFVLDIKNVGAPTVDAKFTFTFTSANTPTLTVTGVRSSVFCFAPNWNDRITDRREWRTDIIEAFDGTEQRRRTRGSPRRQIEFSLGVEASDRRYLMSSVWDLGARTWQLPVWFDGQALTVDLPIGSTVINIDTSHRDFVIGGVAVLLGEKSRPHEALEILSFTASSITLKRPTVKAWPSGTMIYPARTARLDGSYGTSAFTGDYSTGQVRFDILSPSDWPAALPVTLYRGVPVLTNKPNWLRDPSMDFSRLAERFDDDIGIATQYDRGGIPKTRQAHDWTMFSKAEVSSLLGLIYGLRGKCGELWVPTWHNDLKVVAAITAGATALQVEWLGYTLHLQADINRRDIRIELNNGSVFYRRITASSELSSAIESIGIDASLGIAVAITDIAQISFLSLCRSDSDILEIEYWQGNVAEAATAWRGVKRDI